MQVLYGEIFHQDWPWSAAAFMGFSNISIIYMVYIYNLHALDYTV